MPDVNDGVVKNPDGSTLSDTQLNLLDPSATPAVKDGEGPGENEHMIPKSRFDEINDKKKQFEIENQLLREQLAGKEESETTPTANSRMEGGTEVVSLTDYIRKKGYDTKIGLEADQLEALAAFQTDQMTEPIRHLVNTQADLSIEIQKMRMKQNPVYKDFDKYEEIINKEIAKQSLQMRQNPKLMENLYFWAKGKSSKSLLDDSQPGAEGRTIVSPNSTSSIPRVEGGSAPATNQQVSLTPEMQAEVETLLDRGWKKESALDSVIKRFKRKQALEAANKK